MKKFLIVSILAVAHIQFCFGATSLREIHFSQGIFKDTLILSFNKQATCMYEPSAEHELEGQYVDQKEFFFPLVSINAKLRNALNALTNLNQKDYSISCELTKNPLLGLRLAIRYNPDSLDFMTFLQEAHNEEQNLKFEFIPKSYKEMPWLTPALHQPRVVLKIAHPQLRHVLQQQLSLAGCEVFLVMPGTPVQRYASFVNMVDKADVFIAVDNSPIQKWIIEKDPQWFVKQCSQAPETHDILSKYKYTQYEKNKKIAHFLKEQTQLQAQENPAVKSSYEFQTEDGTSLLDSLIEMPSIRLKIPYQKNYAHVSDVIVSALMRYFEDQPVGCQNNNEK